MLTLIANEVNVELSTVIFEQKMLSFVSLISKLFDN